MGRRKLNAVQCTSCAATFTFAAGETSQDCPFCGTSVVLAPQQVRQLVPDGLLPFAISKDQARDGAKWLGTLFFAPQ